MNRYSHIPSNTHKWIHVMCATCEQAHLVVGARGCGRVHGRGWFVNVVRVCAGGVRSSSFF